MRERGEREREREPVSCKKKKEQAASFFLVRLSLTQVVARSHSSPSSLVVKAASDTLSSSLDAFPLAAGRSSSREGEPRPTSPTAMARVTHGVREEKREKIASLPAKCLSDVARRASSVEKAWLLEPANSLSAHLSQFDTTSPPTTTTKLSPSRVPSSPSGAQRGPRRTRAPSREAQAPRGTTACLRCSSSSSQSVSARLSQFSIRFFPYRRPSPSPPRSALLPRREGRGVGAKSSAGRGAGTGESWESRLKGAFGSLFILFQLSIRAPQLNRHFFFSLFLLQPRPRPLSHFLSLFFILSLSLSHPHT